MERRQSERVYSEADIKKTLAMKAELFYSDDDTKETLKMKGTTHENLMHIVPGSVIELMNGSHLCKVEYELVVVGKKGVITNVLQAENMQYLQLLNGGPRLLLPSDYDGTYKVNKQGKFNNEYIYNQKDEGRQDKSLYSKGFKDEYKLFGKKNLWNYGSEDEPDKDHRKEDSIYRQ